MNKRRPPPAKKWMTMDNDLHSVDDTQMFLKPKENEEALLVPMDIDSILKRCYAIHVNQYCENNKKDGR